MHTYMCVCIKERKLERFVGNLFYSELLRGAVGYEFMVQGVWCVGPGRVCQPSGGESEQKWEHVMTAK